MKKGWYGNSKKHSLASKGVKSKIEKANLHYSKASFLFQKNIIDFWFKRGYVVSNAYILKREYEKPKHTVYTVVIDFGYKNIEPTKDYIHHTIYENIAIELKNNLNEYIDLQRRVYE